jgi:hypothetical protein
MRCIANGFFGLAISFFMIGCVSEDDDLIAADPTGGEVVGDAWLEHFDDVRAAAIAKEKRAVLGVAEIEAQVAACGTPGPTGTSRRVDDAAFTGAAKQRSGSSTSCLALGVLQPSDDALYFCFTFASGNVSWTYNQNLRTGVRGWTRDDLLRGSGSFTYCGF